MKFLVWSIEAALGVQPQWGTEYRNIHIEMWAFNLNIHIPPYMPTLKPMQCQVSEYAPKFQK
jgi:hypothetical protein